MVKSKFKAGIATLAACGLIAASPALGAATRSAQALPLLAASVGSVPYATGAENSWRCVSVTDEALKLDKKPVQVDSAGRVVVDPKGAPFGCRSPVTNYQVGAASGGFPFEILLGIVGLGGGIILLAGGKDSDG